MVTFSWLTTAFTQHQVETIKTDKPPRTLMYGWPYMLWPRVQLRCACGDRPAGALLQVLCGSRWRPLCGPTTSAAGSLHEHLLTLCAQDQLAVAPAGRPTNMSCCLHLRFRCSFVLRGQLQDALLGLFLDTWQRPRPRCCCCCCGSYCCWGSPAAAAAATGAVVRARSITISKLLQAMEILQTFWAPAGPLNAFKEAEAGV